LFDETPEFIERAEDGLHEHGVADADEAPQVV
jgi:hypothetical protein